MNIIILLLSLFIIIIQVNVCPLLSFCLIIHIYKYKYSIEMKTHKQMHEFKTMNNNNIKIYHDEYPSKNFYIPNTNKFLSPSQCIIELIWNHKNILENLEFEITHNKTERHSRIRWRKDPKRLFLDAFSSRTIDLNLSSNLRWWWRF